MKRELTEWEKVVASDTSDKGSFPKYIKEYNSTPRRQMTQLKNGKDLNRDFSKEDI